MIKYPARLQANEFIPMSYQVLARKYRPASFSELAGQEHVLRALINALDNDRLHHAFLFTGTRGVGKTTIARILAKSLNCEEGISSTPCGQCSACREISEGRFVDLIEVDAASRTRVDDTRELLDNVQYAPSRGRYKVYLIDEVHMLSSHSFNALLKTLEEPPPHVKFLLATTDPQKLPVTVLSRCLQFNLKRLPVSVIRDQMLKILSSEGLEADAAAVELVARAADGSMRDGLSLLDQAIAFGGGALGETDVRAMLGTVERDDVFRLLDALADGDGATLLDAVAELDTRAPDYLSVLDEMATALQRMAVIQMVPEAGSEWDARERLQALSERLGPEDVQLYYQIAIHGRRDLPLAPEARAGLEMTLLRMLAFRPAAAEAAGSANNGPQGAVTGRKTTHAPSGPTSPSQGAGRPSPTPQATSVSSTESPPASPASTQAPSKPASSTPSPESGEGGASMPSPANWTAVVDALGLKGLARQLADNIRLEGWDGDTARLNLDRSAEQLRTPAALSRLEKALSRFCGKPVTLKIRVSEAVDDTPARRQAAREERREEDARVAIEGDPNVRALQEAFGPDAEPRAIRYRSAADQAPSGDSGQ